MNNLPHQNWNSSASSSFHAATPGQMGMALAMKSMFNNNNAAHIPGHNANFGAALNPYHQGPFAPLNAGFRPGMGCVSVHQNMHGFPGMMMTQPPRPPNMRHRPSMNRDRHNQGQHFQDKVAEACRFCFKGGGIMGLVGDTWGWQGFAVDPLCVTSCLQLYLRSLVNFEGREGAPEL